MSGVNRYAIQKSLLLKLSTPLNEIKVSFIETLFIQSVVFFLVSISFFFQMEPC